MLGGGAFVEARLDLFSDKATCRKIKKSILDLWWIFKKNTLSYFMICVELATIEKKIWQVLFYWRNSACDTSLAQKSWMEWYHNSGHLKTSKFRKKWGGRSEGEGNMQGDGTCSNFNLNAKIFIELFLHSKFISFTRSSK